LCQDWKKLNKSEEEGAGTSGKSFFTLDRRAQKEGRQKLLSGSSKSASKIGVEKDSLHFFRERGEGRPQRTSVPEPCWL